MAKEIGVRAMCNHAQKYIDENYPDVSKVEDPLSAEDDSSVSIKAWTDEKVITVTCDRTDNITVKERLRRSRSKAEKAPEKTPLEIMA